MKLEGGTPEIPYFNSWTTLPDNNRKMTYFLFTAKFKCYTSKFNANLRNFTSLIVNISIHQSVLIASLEILKFILRRDLQYFIHKKVDKPSRITCIRVD